MPILLCRRMRIATRGVDVERGQQRSAGLAGAMDGDPGDSGGDDAAVEAAAEVTRLDRRTVPRGEDQAGVDNPVPGEPWSRGQRDRGSPLTSIPGVRPEGLR